MRTMALQTPTAMQKSHISYPEWQNVTKRDHSTKEPTSITLDAAVKQHQS